MSEVKRYMAIGGMLPGEGFGAGVFVRDEDFRAAQAELAILQKQLGERWLDISALNETIERQSDELEALRGELAQVRDDMAAQRNHFRAQLADAKDADQLQQRLTAAERRKKAFDDFDPPDAEYGDSQ